MASWRRILKLARGTDPAAEPQAEFKRIVLASGILDTDWYVRHYPDVRLYPGGPVAHFCRYGLLERRDPAPLISTAAYLRRFPAALASSRPALVHALETLPGDERTDAFMPEPGDEASLRYLLVRHRLFDEAWYVRRYRDVSRSGIVPLDHFVRHGAFELRDPGPGFDTDYYLQGHQNYTLRSATPIEHFVRYGLRQGATAVGPPPYRRWLLAFDDLTPDDLARIGAAGARAEIAAFHVIDRDAMPWLDDIVAAWRSQVGVDLRLRLVRGRSLKDADWEACLASARTFAFELAGPEDLGSVPEGRTVLLVAGASLVRPHAGALLSRALAEGGMLAAYADHDHVARNGTRHAPVFKPYMSAEFMRRSAYAGAVVATVASPGRCSDLSRAIAQAVDGAAEVAWARYLLDLPGKAVTRVPFILSHQAVEIEREVARYEAVEATMAVTVDERPTSEVATARVSIVIPTRDRVDLLKECLDSILTDTDYPADLMAIIIVDNSSTDPSTLDYLAALAVARNVSVVASPGPFNFAAICNDGAAQASGDVLVFLNNDMTVKQRDWLAKLVRFAVEPDVGAVGAQLLYPDGTVQHGGVVLGVRGVGAHRLVGQDPVSDGFADATREMVAMTGACLAIRRSVFMAMGGFDPLLRIAFNDVKLCASLHEAGYRNLYIGEPLLYHHESRSRGFDDSRLKQHRNQREAIYVRERFGALFQNEPSYSPNLSLEAIGELADPPRVVRPWRRSPSGRPRLLLLSLVHTLGHGVATVVALQAAHLRDRGWDITVGGPVREGDRTYEGCRRVDLWTAKAAAAHAVAEAMDGVIAHTPPFFSIVRFLGASPFVYFYDHGEPPPDLFPDRQKREDVDWEKRFCAPLARHVLTISETVARHQYRRDAMVLRNGNSHLAAWSDDWRRRRRALRKARGFEGRFVVLNVCRFGPQERYYKGIDQYGQVASEIVYRYPQLDGQLCFALAGRASPEDVEAVEALGLSAFANLTDEDMLELYAASDLFMSLSRWEGYNLGIGQALAMGLEVTASDVEAHREFGVATFDSVPDLCAAVARAYASWDENAESRTARVASWEPPLGQLTSLLETDLSKTSLSI